MTMVDLEGMNKILSGKVGYISGCGAKYTQCNTRQTKQQPLKKHDRQSHMTWDASEFI
jgi:hypothetical protein